MVESLSRFSGSSVHSVHHGLETRIRVRPFALQVFDKGVAYGLQILPSVRILGKRTELGHEVSRPLPYAEELAIALEEEVLVEYAGGDKRRRHVPVADHHTEVGIFLAAGR